MKFRRLAILFALLILSNTIFGQDKWTQVKSKNFYLIGNASERFDAEGNLTDVVETSNIVKTPAGAAVNGKEVDVNTLVSMNMWGLTPDFLSVLEEGFKEFFEKEVSENPLKAEYLIPIFIGELLSEGKMSVKVLKTNDGEGQVSSPVCYL